MSCPAKIYYASRFLAVIIRLTEHFIRLRYFGINAAIIKFNTSGNYFIKPSLKTMYV